MNEELIRRNMVVAGYSADEIEDRLSEMAENEHDRRQDELAEQHFADKQTEEK